MLFCAIIAFNFQIFEVTKWNMRYVAAYMLAAMSGKHHVTTADIENILGSVGVDCDHDKASKVVDSMHGKSVDELIAQGSQYLCSVGGTGLWTHVVLVAGIVRLWRLRSQVTLAQERKGRLANSLAHMEHDKVRSRMGTLLMHQMSNKSAPFAYREVSCDEDSPAGMTGSLWGEDKGAWSDADWGGLCVRQD